MSAPRVCPYPDLPCGSCVEVFLDQHPGAEVWTHTYHHQCGCPKIATLADGDDVCLNCGELRDVVAEFEHVMRGAA